MFCSAFEGFDRTDIEGSIKFCLSKNPSATTERIDNAPIHLKSK